MREVQHRWSVASAAVLALALLSGCAAPAETSAPPPATSNTVPTPFPTPDLGERPPVPVLSDAEAEAERFRYQDESWARVLASFPNAIRPAIEFDGYLPYEDYFRVTEACYEAAGVELSYSTGADGKINGFSPLGSDEATLIAVFTCDAENPTRPEPPPSTAELEWLYRYLTEYLVPCFAAHGVENPEAPSKSDFVTQWPNQNWFPSSGDVTDIDERAAIEADCSQDGAGRHPAVTHEG